MNRRVSIVVLCALILSACASYLAYRAVRSGSPAAHPAPPAIQLLVASQDLAIGTLIHDADLKMASWTGPLPKGAMSKRDSFLNRGVASAIYEGEPITEARLAPTGSGGGLAATIPPGMRAAAVKVDDVVGVAGFVVSGMRVDVLITGLPPGGNPVYGPQVRTLLQNIQVLSAGTNFHKDQEGKPEPAQVVNLLVTPAQAEILSLASNETHIQLVLRNPMDTELTGLPGTILSDLYGSAHVTPAVRPNRPKTAPPTPHVGPFTEPLPAPAHAPPAAGPYTVEVSNGAVHTEAKFSRQPGK